MRGVGGRLHAEKPAEEAWLQAESKAKKKYDYQKHIQMQQLMAMGNPQEYFGDEWGAPGTMGPMGPGPLMGQTMLKMGPPDPEYMMPGPMGFAGPFGPPGMRFPGPFPPMMMGFMGPPQHMPPHWYPSSGHAVTGR